MAALAQALSRASGADIDVDSLFTVVLFCGVGLLATFCMMRYGLDFGSF